MSQNPYTVVIADDHYLIRQALRTLLEVRNEFHVVGEARRGAEVFDAIAEHRPDALVLDWTMPGANGRCTLRRVAERWPELVIVSFSMHDPLGFEAKALEAGAHAYVGKDEPETLLGRLRDALERRRPCRHNPD